MSIFLSNQKDIQDTTILTIRFKLQSIMQTLQKEKQLFQSDYREKLNRCQSQLQQKEKRIRQLQEIIVVRDALVDDLSKQNAKLRGGMDDVKANFLKMIKVVNKISNNNEGGSNDDRLVRLKSDHSQTKFNKLSTNLKSSPSLLYPQKFDINRYFLDTKSQHTDIQIGMNIIPAQHKKDSSPPTLSSNAKSNHSQSIQSYYQSLSKKHSDKQNIQLKFANKASRQSKIQNNKGKQTKSYIKIKEYKQLYGHGTY